MAYPPTVPPNSRANSTSTFDNHASDHNAVANALTDIINELGADPKAGFADLAARIDALVPAGTIVAYGGSSAPSGYLMADGTAVSRTTYAALFSAIGTTYGTGDGSTTFNKPNLKGRIPVGREAGTAPFDTLGETGGNRDAVAVTHWHTVNGHVHGLNSHVHPIAHVHATVSNTSRNVQGVTGAINSWSPPGGTATEGYTPLEDESTGPSSNTNSSGPSPTNTTSTSPGTDTGTGTEAGTNKNIQPYQVVNYIIRV